MPEEIIVAIIGIETIYGRNMEKFPTLATWRRWHSTTRRGQEFIPQRTGSVTYCSFFYNRTVIPCLHGIIRGGALGLFRISPSSIRNWGLDFDYGDERAYLAAKHR
ncbi:MAG: lytic murein transglycosylase [Rhodocyclaceae bacterium]|nr:lytic murein transglycosylase [Rhodocyclaceae bacterium]